MGVLARLRQVTQAARKAEELRLARCQLQALITFHPARCSGGDGLDNKLGVIYHANREQMRVELVEADGFRPRCPLCGRNLSVIEATETEIRIFKYEDFHWPDELKGLAILEKARL